mmetsp:Transcript_2824/g.17571  ORF Transcript_2824/g.17571 Transcript_2824/m.17571 type:complete len:159 (+) Transcript_2824:5645-6121(+)
MEYSSGVENQMENIPLSASVPSDIRRSIHVISALEGEITGIIQFLEVIASCPMLPPLLQVVLKQSSSGVHAADYGHFSEPSYLAVSQRSRCSSRGGSQESHTHCIVSCSSGKALVPQIPNFQVSNSFYFQHLESSSCCKQKTGFQYLTHNCNYQQHER